MGNFFKLFGANLADNFESETEGMACTAAGDDAPAGYCRARLEPGSCHLEGGFKAVETGNRSTGDALELAQHQAGGGAYRSYRSSRIVMLLHEADEGFARSEALAAWHSAGEDEHVPLCGAGMVCILHERKAVVHAYGDPVRRAYEWFFGYAYQFAAQPCPAQDVIRSEGLYILEAVCKKNINSFHWRKSVIFVSVNIRKMEEEKKLVPFRLCTLEDTYPWGSETWALADLGWRDTAVRDGWLAGNMMGEVMETYLDRITGDGAFDWYGLQFPFCIKTLHIDGRMPLTVCPDDELARERYDSLGKEKFWYVLDAAPGAKVLAGLRRDVSAAGFLAACEDGSIEGIMNQAPVKAGSYYHIPAGTPHCLLGKATVLEISQSSALDFRLCSWGLSSEEDYGLGLVEALDFVNLSKYPAEALLGYSLDARREGDPENVNRLVSLPQFTVSLISLAEPLKISEGEGNSCVAYSCLKGGMNIQLPLDEGGKADFLKISEGETVLVPAECDEFFLVPVEKGTVLLETMIEPRPEKDSYVVSGQ